MTNKLTPSQRRARLVRAYRLAYRALRYWRKRTHEAYTDFVNARETYRAFPGDFNALLVDSELSRLDYARDYLHRSERIVSSLREVTQ